ncbi:enoyl-CoA hydratase/isomerase family protein [soil metagenome]
MTAADPAEVLVAREGRVGRLTLNRPKALHALTQAMCQTMTDALLAWRDDPAVDLVILDHAGPRGFCAGGDIRKLAQSGLGDGAEARSFFATEYRLNHLLFAYPKPTIAVMDGLVMGGGAGLTLPCRHRIATENTVFAMPETGIGLFPDVGGGWYLPRLPGQAGLWLGLTGARLKAADGLRLGLATAYVDSARLEVLKAALLAQPAAVEAVLGDFASDPGPAPFDAQAEPVDRLFAGDSLEAILAALATDESDWAKATLDILAAKSPQALKVTFRQLALGAQARDFAAHMAMEFRVGARLVHRHDFLQGVRAVIIAKDNDPRWFPSDVAAISEDILDQIFAPLPADQEWTPLGVGASS